MSPITALKKLVPQSEVTVKITKSEDEKEIIAVLTVNGETFEGRAGTRVLAKLKAYKKAVRKYDPDGKIIFF